MTALPESLTAAALLGTARSAPEFGALHTAGAAGELAGDPAATLLAADEPNIRPEPKETR